MLIPDLKDNVILDYFALFLIGFSGYHIVFDTDKANVSLSCDKTLSGKKGDREKNRWVCQLEFVTGRLKRL